MSYRFTSNCSSFVYYRVELRSSGVSRCFEFISVGLVPKRNTEESSGGIYASMNSCTNLGLRMCLQQEIGGRIRDFEVGVAERRNQKVDRELAYGQKRGQREQVVRR